MALAREKVLEEAAKALEAESKGQAGVSLVVIGEPELRYLCHGHLYSPKATSMLESRRSWEDCSMTPAASTKNQKWQTKGRAVRLAKGASAGRGSLTVPPKSASGKRNLRPNANGGTDSEGKGCDDGHCRANALDTPQEHHHTGRSRTPGLHPEHDLRCFSGRLRAARGRCLDW